MTKFSKFWRSTVLLAAMTFGMGAQAQSLSEGWYQITRNMSASDLAKRLEGNTDFWSNALGFFGDLTRNDYLYVAEEFVEEQEIFGIKTGQRTYGAKYKNGLTEQISTGDVNTYFYITPVEGENEAYTIRSYNGHYLHTDGTFSVEPQTLYLNPSFNFSMKNTFVGTHTNWYDKWMDDAASLAIDLAVGAANLTVGIFKNENISGYSIGVKPETFELDTRNPSGSLDLSTILSWLNVKLPIGFSIAYNPQSWQQSIKEIEVPVEIDVTKDVEVTKEVEVTDEFGNVTTQTVTEIQTVTEKQTVMQKQIVRGDYVDAKNIDPLRLGWNALTGINISDYNNLANSLIRFVLTNFASDSYRFRKIDLNNVANGGDGYLGSIIGALNRQELIPYTVKIEGWDNTFTVNKPKDANTPLGVVGDFFNQITGGLGINTVNQLTHTNASVLITSDAQHREFESSPIYDGGTVFAVKGKSIFNQREGSFVDKGSEHTCSSVVITPYDYQETLWGLLGSNGVQNFSNCISAACVDEENHIIHVYFTEPGKTWRVDCAEGKYVTRNAPFNLELQDVSILQSIGGFIGLDKTSDDVEVSYPTTVDGNDEVVLETISGKVIPAHTPVLIKNTHTQKLWPLDIKVTDHMIFKVVESSDVESPEGNLLHGVCFPFELDNDVKAYVLKSTGNGKEQKFFMLNQTDRLLSPWRAYLEWDGDLNNATSGLRIALDEDALTGVDTVLENNEEVPVYDLSGRRIVKMQNGFQINGGKKVIK